MGVDIAIDGDEVVITSNSAAGPAGTPDETSDAAS